MYKRQGFPQHRRYQCVARTGLEVGPFRFHSGLLKGVLSGIDSIGVTVVAVVELLYSAS